METSAKSGFNSKELFINGANLLYRMQEKINDYEKRKNSNESKILDNIKKKKFALKKCKIKIKKKDDDDDDEEEEEDENDSICCS